MMKLQKKHKSINSREKMDPILPSGGQLGKAYRFLMVGPRNFCPRWMDSKVSG